MPTPTCRRWRAGCARRLRTPLDLLLVRKIGVPGQPELTLAAVVEGDPPTLVIDEANKAHEAFARGLAQRLC